MIYSRSAMKQSLVPNRAQRYVGSCTEHQKMLRESLWNQPARRRGMIVTVCAANDSFCSSIGDLTNDGEGSSKSFSVISCHSGDTSSSNPSKTKQQQAMFTVDEGMNHASSIHEQPDDASTDKAILTVVPPSSIFDNGKDKTLPKKDNVNFADETMVIIPLTSRWRRGEDRNLAVPCEREHMSPIKRSMSKGEDTQTRVQDYSSPQAIVRNLQDERKEGRPIQRYSSLSPKKSSAKRSEVVQGIKQTEMFVRPPDLTSERRSRSESEVKSPQKTVHTVQRNRSAGDRPFQFLQRIKGKVKPTRCDDDAMTEHACETDKIMNSVAGSLPAPTNGGYLSQDESTLSPSKRYNPRPDKQVSRSTTESFKLLAMARCVSPSKDSNSRRRAMSTDKQIPGQYTLGSKQQFEEFLVYPCPNSYITPSRHLKKQRSKSLVCSPALPGFETAHPELCPMPLNTRTRSASMGVSDAPPRQPRRNRSSFTPRPQPLEGNKKDEDWHIASLDEESTVTSHGQNLETMTQFYSKQEDELMLLAMERSLEESNPAAEPVVSIPTDATNVQRPLANNDKLWWVKGTDNKWAALPFPIEDEATADSEMLEMVMKSSLEETMKLVHLHLLSSKAKSY